MASFAGFANIGKVPELRKRVIFTLVMLAVYRVGVFVTIPGVDRSVMQQVVSKGLVRGRFDKIKILGDGELTKAVTVSAHAFSKTAADKIKKAGGKVVLVGIAQQ